MLFYMFQTNAFDIWRKEEGAPKIITLCKELDDQLLGGIQLGWITEFCGASGAGKTNMCLQLSINVQYPKEVGGLAGKALYVDTNQGFHPERLKEIAFYMDERFQKIYKTALPNTAFNVCSMLENVAYSYCETHAELLETVSNLKSLLSQDPALKLIIIDSFAFLLRRIVDVDERSKIIYDLLTDLRRLAMKFQIAIVITNELTTRITGDNQWQVVPALGDTHTHMINQRLVLRRPEKSGAPFVVMIEKSVVSARVCIPFQVHFNKIVEKSD